MQISRRLYYTIILLLLVILSATFHFTARERDPGAKEKLPYSEREGNTGEDESLSPVEQIPEEELTTADLVLLGARQETDNRTVYDDSYQNIEYPGGDVPSDQGACTDVVIRAFRHAGIDLQRLIHEDMRENFSLYPQKWGLSGPDTNIDHRRVPNQMRFFERFGKTLSTEKEDILDQWQWGDIVCWRYPSGQYHVGVVSDRTNQDGVPLVIHNDSKAREEDCLFRWEIIGYFRYP